MNNYEFYAILLANVDTFLLSMFISFMFYFILFRKRITSVLDPIILQIIASVFGFTVVLFLFLVNAITPLVFTSYVVTQLAFFAGFFTFKTSRPSAAAISFDRNWVQIKLCFLYLSAILVFLQFYIYSQRGIPLLMESRLEYYTGGSGFGIFSRIVDVLLVACIYLYFDLLFNKKIRLTNLFYTGIFLLIVLFLVLSGSKSSFIAVGFVLYCYLQYNAGNLSALRNISVVLKKSAKWIIIVAVIFTIFIIVVQSRNEDESLNPVFALILRFVHNADVFWYAYPENTYLRINGSEPFKALFTDLLGYFRIYSWEEMPQAIGIDLKQIHHPSDVLSGPNARHNVFGLIYFGFWGAIPFSYIMGLLLSFIRHRLAFVMPRNFFAGILFTLLYIKSTAIEGDPMLAFTYFNNCLIVFPAVFVSFLFFYELFKLSYRYSNI